MGEVHDRVTDQVNGEIRGFESELTKLNAELSELEARREALLEQLDEARDVLAHHRKRPVK